MHPDIFTGGHKLGQPGPVQSAGAIPEQGYGPDPGADKEVYPAGRAGRHLAVDRDDSPLFHK